MISTSFFIDYVETADELGWPIQTKRLTSVDLIVGDCLNKYLDICQEDEQVFRLVVDVNEHPRHGTYSYVQFPVKR